MPPVLDKNVPSGSAIEELFTRLLPNALEQAAEQYHDAAQRAEAKGCLVEASVLHHLATRLRAPRGSLKELAELLAEMSDLNSWLPVPANQRNCILIERRAAQIRLIRSLRLDRENENMLISLVTQKPGRPAEVRGVAVRAMELHERGQTWEQIERLLIPHRRCGVRNPGRSINREVQFLKQTLARYSVSLDRH
jgi:hypothetical protein